MSDEKITYLAGRPIKVDGKNYDVGDEVDVSTIPHLDAFVSTGHLYKVHDDKDNAWIPPHLYNSVMSYKEARAKIDGDPGVSTTAAKEADDITGDAKRLAEGQAQVQDSLARGRTDEDRKRAARAVEEAHQPALVPVEEEPKEKPEVTPKTAAKVAGKTEAKPAPKARRNTKK